MLRVMRVDVVFTDKAGRRWKLYDWSVISGHKYRQVREAQAREAKARAAWANIFQPTRRASR